MIFSRTSGKRRMHLPSFHSFSWSSRISVDSASFRRVASSMLASRAMDLRRAGKVDQVQQLKNGNTCPTLLVLQRAAERPLT